MTNPVQFKVMLPADVKAWLEAEAAKNVRSQGAEIVFILRDHMARSTATTDR